MRFALVMLLAVAVLAGCGDDDEQPAAPPAALADLLVVVDSDGRRGPQAPREAEVRCAAPGDSAVCRVAAGLTPRDFAPVPDNVACTLQYGGPDTARVTGTLRGERVEARFSLTDGCEITRWSEVAHLLEAAAP